MLDRGLRIVGALGLAAAAVALGAAAPQKPAAKPLPGRSVTNGNWNTVVRRTADDTYILGNPDAKVRLTEFISYTCPHCAHFETEADAPLRLAFVANGKGSIEVRSFVRDPIDMTVALLTHCGPPEKFFLNHTAFLRSQAKWIAPLKDASAAQKARWSSGSFAARTRAIADDFHFYPIMATRGYTAQQVDKCLTDEALANRLAKATEDAAQRLFVRGTPSFAIDGVVLSGTSDWASLRPQLAARVD
ncbi:thioredoxin domain-containing protein [Novosphingobium tardum]|uniref:Thioredoxin domain-containing protein n=1 Tax=Novosphingobium tardum TaxID=1538021 RepID=A0ABV8RTW6_9SPHN